MGTTTTTVRSVVARPVLAPLDPPLQTASGEVPAAPLVLVDVTASDGVVGHAYLYCLAARGADVPGAPRRPPRSALSRS
jgi:hypothetical protein